MKVGGDEEADNNGNDTKKFDFFVGRNAVYEVICDGFIEKDYGAAGSGDN